MADVFISYAAEDSALAHALCQRLEEFGLTVYDEAFDALHWRDRVPASIRVSDVAVVFWSPASAGICRETCAAAEAADRPLLIAYSAGAFDEAELYLGKYRAYAFNPAAPEGLGLLADAVLAAFDEMSASAAQKIETRRDYAELPAVIDVARDVDWDCEAWVSRALAVDAAEVNALRAVVQQAVSLQVRSVKVAQARTGQIKVAQGGGARGVMAARETGGPPATVRHGPGNASNVAIESEWGVAVWRPAGTSASWRGKSAAPLGGWVKRGFDIVASASLIVLLAPLLFIIALAIRLDGPGQAIFRQERGGLNGRTFRMWKFRTMTVIETRGVVQARHRDVRLTRLGPFLRRSSFDELPQLFNVLVGDMSIIGPRPHALEHDVLFEKIDPRYPQRFHARPGVTGLAQVNGSRGPIETEEKVIARTGFDVEYVRSWSFWRDLKILARTLKLMLIGPDRAL